MMRTHRSRGEWWKMEEQLTPLLPNNKMCFREVKKLNSHSSRMTMKGEPPRVS